MMDSTAPLHEMLSGTLSSLNNPFWNHESIADGSEFGIPSEQDALEDIRLPKRRRYCGDDTSRHSWDSQGFMSTEPPTPVLLEQQEPVDSEAVFPYFSATSMQRSSSSKKHHYQHPLSLPEGSVVARSSHNHHHHSKSATNSGRSSTDASPSTVARVRWLESDDKLLIKLVSENGHNWPLIASRMEGRTSKQVKERWTNQLDPTISTDPWTAEDDQQLVELIRELGHSWCEIARRMKGRTESMVKNRFHANLRKRFGPQVFDPSEPLPLLTFKPKSSKSKKSVISDEIRIAAAEAVSKNGGGATRSNTMHRMAMPLPTSFSHHV